MKQHLSIALIVGATVLNFFTANPVIGPIHGMRFFHSGMLPASFAGTPESKLPTGVVPVVSYKWASTNTTSYVRSIHRPVWIIPYHEPEDNFATGASFITWFESQTRQIRAVGNPYIKVAYAANWYRYRTGANAANCSYVPPAWSLNYYLIDVYNEGTTLRTNTGMQNWLHCTANRGRYRGVAEYGVWSCNGNTWRLNTIKSDVAYMSQVMPSSRLLLYWWRSADDHTGCYWSYQFTDNPTINYWRSLER